MLVCRIYLGRIAGIEEQADYTWVANSKMKSRLTAKVFVEDIGRGIWNEDRFNCIVVVHQYCSLQLSGSAEFWLGQLCEWELQALCSPGSSAANLATTVMKSTSGYENMSRNPKLNGSGHAIMVSGRNPWVKSKKLIMIFKRCMCGPSPIHLRRQLRRLKQN